MKRLDAENLLKFLEEYVRYDSGFLYVKKTWAKKSPIGKNICILKGDYYMTSINGIWYKSHRLIYLILNKELPEVVDHIDRNKLNNLGDNLRGCSKSENERNRTEYSTNTSGYKGVWLHKQRSKWCAEISVDGKSIKLGLFTTPEQAAEAYNDASTKYRGEFGFQNLIKKGN